MIVTVFSALQTELDLLIESMGRPSPTEVAGRSVWTGNVGDNQVVLARAGLGKVNTAALAALVWERHRPALMIFTGVAGGLDPDLGIGEVVVGETTIQHDTGVVGPGGELHRYQPGHIPFFNPTDEFGFSPSPELMETMRQVVPAVELTPVLDRRPRVVFGTILTGDVFLQDAATRDRLYAELSAQAIEMEGAALGQVTANLGVDHLVIRSLSDTAGGDAVEDFGRFVPEVAANSARLVLALLEHYDRDLTIGA